MFEIKLYLLVVAVAVFYGVPVSLVVIASLALASI